MDKPRVLYLTYRNYFPIASGEKITMMQNLRFLSERYDVECLVIDEKKKFKKDGAGLKNQSDRIIYFSYPNKFIRILNTLKNLFLGLPLQNGYFYSRKAKRFLESTCHEYDLIFCTHMRTGQYVATIPGIKKVLVCPDCITLNAATEAKSTSGLRKLIFSLETKPVRRYESRFYEKFDYLYTISQRDKDALISIAPQIEGKIGLLYNSARDLGYSPTRQESSNKQICFLGRIMYGPNITALRYFVREVFPALKSEYPELVFNIYGGGSDAKIKSLGLVDGVRIHGFVDDVAKEIQANTFVIAPMVSGSGTQNKVLECMLLKKLVILTKIAMDGLYDLKGDELVCANGTEELIQKCLYYLSDENVEERRRIEERAREYVASHFAVETSRRQLLDPLEAILD